MDPILTFLLGAVYGIRPSSHLARKENIRRKLFCSIYLLQKHLWIKFYPIWSILFHWYGILLTWPSTVIKKEEWRIFLILGFLLIRVVIWQMFFIPGFWNTIPKWQSVSSSKISYILFLPSSVPVGNLNLNWTEFALLSILIHPPPTQKDPNSLK